MYDQNAADQVVRDLRRLFAVHPEAVSTIGEIVGALRILLGQASKLPTGKIDSAASILRVKETAGQHLVVDPDGLAVHWKGKTCFLGKTLAFEFFARLASSPGHYISHAVLLDDVWKYQVSKEAMRSLIKSLKQKLRNAGMEDLAQAIDGTRRECYGLMIAR
jgi:DNA-binding response OmpR family regulator